MREPRTDLRTPDAEADLYLVGLGIGGLDRITVETRKLLSRARAILHLTPHDRELRQLASDASVHDLNLVYRSSDVPAEVYASITERIVATAEASDGISCFVTYGHPLYMVDSSVDVLALAAAGRTSLRVKAVPAVSSFDTLLVDVPIRLDRGVAIHEASLFVAQDVCVDIRFPLVLNQFGDFGSRKLRPEAAQVERFAPLVERLKQIFPQERITYVAFSSWRAGVAPIIISVPLRNLTSVLHRCHVGTTLIVSGDE